MKSPKNPEAYEKFSSGITATYNKNEPAGLRKTNKANKQTKNKQQTNKQTNKQKTETKMTASVLKQDPDTRKVQQNAIYLFLS